MLNQPLYAQVFPQYDIFGDDAKTNSIIIAKGIRIFSMKQYKPQTDVYNSTVCCDLITATEQSWALNINTTSMIKQCGDICALIDNPCSFNSYKLPVGLSRPIRFFSLWSPLSAEYSLWIRSNSFPICNHNITMLQQTTTTQWASCEGTPTKIMKLVLPRSENLGKYRQEQVVRETYYLLWDLLI